MFTKTILNYNDIIKEEIFSEKILTDKMNHAYYNMKERVKNNPPYKDISICKD